MAVLGIDLGTLYTKVASVGRNGLQIVRNDLADRTTPTLLSYTQSERLVGDSAFNSIKANANSTVRNFVHLAGVTNSCDDLISYEKSFSLAPITSDKSDNFVMFEVQPGESFMAVEVLIPFLTKLRMMSETYLECPVTECVVSTPVWFNASNYDAIVCACKLAGLNCLRTLPHSHATAMDFGLFRRKSLEEGQTIRVGFVDIGYGQATVTIVDYTSKNFTIVLSQEDIQLGSRSIDLALINYAVEQFNAKHKVDVRNNRKAMLKLSDAIEKAKKVLSANKESIISLECFYEDYDLELSMTREMLEEHSHEYSAALAVLLQGALDACNEVQKRELNAIEVVGGGTRIPFVINIIEKVFKLHVSRTISADECVARGCAIEAAILDHRFRVAKYDRLVFCRNPIGLIVKDFGENVVFDERKQQLKLIKLNDSETLIPVVPVGVALPVAFSRMLYMPLPGSVNSVSFTLQDEKPISTNSIQIPASVQTACKESPRQCKFKIRIERTDSDMYFITSQFVQEVVVQEAYKEKVPKVDEEGKLSETEFTEVDKTRDKTTYRTTNLTIKSVSLFPYLSNEALNAIKSREAVIAKRDLEAQSIRNIRNDILTQCFKVRGFLVNDSPYTPFLNEELKESILKVTEECESYAEYSGGETYEQYKAAFDRLCAAWAPVEAEYNENSEIKCEGGVAADERKVDQGDSTDENSTTLEMGE